MTDKPTKQVFRSGDRLEITYDVLMPVHPVVGDMITADNGTIVWDGETWVTLADFLHDRRPST